MGLDLVEDGQYSVEWERGRRRFLSCFDSNMVGSAGDFFGGR